MHRREFLSGAAVAAASTAILSSSMAVSAEPVDKKDEKKKAETPKPLKLGVPGPYPGKVIEVRNKALVRNGKRSREEIGKTFRRGLTELTGASDYVEALRMFVEPGEAVGIKVVPNGHPGARSNTIRDGGGWPAANAKTISAGTAETPRHCLTTLKGTRSSR